KLSVRNFGPRENPETTKTPTKGCTGKSRTSQADSIIHSPKKSQPGQATNQTVSHSPQRRGKIGIDFWHAVEFSRIGHTPTTTPQPWDRSRGNLSRLSPPGPDQVRPFPASGPAQGPSTGSGEVRSSHRDRPPGVAPVSVPPSWAGGVKR